MHSLTELTALIKRNIHHAKWYPVVVAANGLMFFVPLLQKYQYLEVNPKDLEQERERCKKLDVYTDEIVSWLRNTQIYR